MDNYYCLIRLQKNKKIALFLFKNNIHDNYKVSPICFTAFSSSLMYNLLSKHALFKKLSIDHIFYIGRELYKAELSLILNQVYVQN